MHKIKYKSMNIRFDIMRYLDEHRITMAAAAKAAGMAPQNIKKCLAGNPKIENVMAVANGLGIDPRKFFYADEETTPVTDRDNHNTLFNTDIKKDTQPTIQTTAICPHCGARFRAGVVLMEE